MTAAQREVHPSYGVKTMPGESPESQLDAFIDKYISENQKERRFPEPQSSSKIQQELRPR